jgi:Ion channel
VRAVATTVALVAAYYLVPLDNLSDTADLALFAVGLAAVIALIALEVRAILKARYPALQAIGALALIAPLFLLLFAVGYYLTERAAPGSFTQRLTRTDSLYFTLTTFSTVGYGDITARSETARITVMFQIISDLVIIGVGAKLLLGAVQTSRQRAATSPAGADASPPPSQTTPTTSGPPSHHS